MKVFGDGILDLQLLYSTGILHDIGKYQPEFQNYLLYGGKRGSVPHASIGAVATERMKLFRSIFAIDGHHAGMPDSNVLKNDHLPTYAEKANPCFQAFLNDLKIDESTFNVKFEYPPPDKLKVETEIRFLFSCLVDADWLDTESFYDTAKSESRTGMKLDTKALTDGLYEKFASFDNKGEVNRLRNTCREYALSHASEAQGFFSLNLPTGLGKTLTSIAWAIRHAEHHRLDRIIIVLPYVNIIEQTAAELKKVFGDDKVLEHHSGFEFVENEDAENYTLTLAAENWDYPIILTTGVQFFETLFSNKPSRCRKFHNIARSVVILDEIQSLPVRLVLPTLNMMKEIQSFMKISFLFCTATQPAFKKRDGFDGIETITPLEEHTDELFARMKRVEYRLLDDLQKVKIADAAQSIVAERNSVLAIVNTKKACFEIFESVKDSFEKAYFLNTNLIPAHRRNVIQDVKLDLRAGKRIVVCSTQVIEAGVDLDFPLVYRQLAPLDSIVQAAGRCNREGKLETGYVTIFRLIDDDGKEHYPDPSYKAYANHTDTFLNARNLSDLQSHDAFTRYYEQIISLFTNPDGSRINEEREQFHFQTVADRYRLIDQAAVSLFIQEYDDASREMAGQILAKLNNDKPLSRKDYRRMREYSVSVYPNFMREQQAQIEEIAEGLYVWTGLYNDKTGLAAGAPAADEMVQ
jgi:CRISPR-associated endonuclease/helicase Cas3